MGIIEAFKKKWWFCLLVVVLGLLIYRVCFYIPKPGFDMEKVEKAGVVINE